MKIHFFLRASLASILSLVVLDSFAAGTKDNPCSPSNLNNCYDGVSGAVTGYDSARVAIPEIKTRSSSEDEDETALFNTRSGLAAGSSAGNYNVWTNLSYIEFESTFEPGAYEADRTTLLIGVDRMIGDRSVLGVALGYEDLSSTTYYNGGGDSEDGYSVIPYYGVALTDTLTFDMLVGYTWLDHDQDRLRSDGHWLYASYDADRLFGAVNLSNTYTHDSIQIEANIGLSYAEENHDGYTETTAGANPRTVDDRTISVTQAELGFGISQPQDNMNPYATIIFRKDLDSDEDAEAGGLPSGVIAHSDDDTEIEFIMGADIYTQKNIDISFSFNTLFSRDDFDKWGLDIGLRMPL